MNRKHNPWVALTALILLAVIIVMACTGCAIKASAVTQKRFSICEEHIGSYKRGNVYASIITDAETGQQYLFVSGYGTGGLTKLED